MNFRVPACVFLAGACLVVGFGRAQTFDNGSSLAARDFDPMERLQHVLLSVAQDPESPEAHCKLGFAYLDLLGYTDHAFAVKQLWSWHESDREAAKQEIIRIGAPAKLPLMSLLEDILNNPSLPRFATGKEIEGEEALRKWEEHASDFPSDVEDLEITSRLERDSCEMLGRLRAVEAIPLLVQIMGRGHVVRKFASMRHEMHALVRIGGEAVPALIDSLRMTEAKMNQLRFADHELAEEKKKSVIGEILAIRARAARVLGEIGDRRALPALEDALQRSGELESWRPDIPYIENAIMRIKQTSR